MKKAFLYAGSDPAPPAAPDSAVLVWDDASLPVGAFSIPALTREWLLAIRNEHMTWAYDMGGVTFMGRQLKDWFLCGSGPSMWWTSLLYERHPRLSPELYAIYKLRALEKWLSEHGCQELTLINAPEKLRNNISRLCEALGIKFYAQKTAKPAADPHSVLEKAYRLMPAPLRAIIRFIHWLWKVRAKLPKRSWASKNLVSPPGQPPPATIVAYFPNIDLRLAAEGHFRSHYWENLHDALKEEAEAGGNGPFVNWLFIRANDSQLSLKQCVRLCALFKAKKEGKSFHYLEEFLTFSDLAGSLLRWLKICLSSLLIQKNAKKHFCFHNSRLNFWCLMKEQWAESFRGWRCLERCLQNLAFLRYCKASGEQRWRLFPLENCPWERMLTQASRTYTPKTPVFGTQHSIIRPTDFRYFDDPRTFSDPDCAIFQPDIIGGNGQSAVRQLLKNGMPEERCKTLEALRYLYLARKQTEQPTPLLNRLPPEPGEPLEPYNPKSLLVLTSFFADETSAHLSLLGNALEANLLKDWQIVIKPHPWLEVSREVQSLPQAARSAIQISDSPLPLLLRPGFLVWTSNSTTAALEAALMGLPLMVMLPVNNFDLCPVQNLTGLARTGSLEDVKRWLAACPIAPVPAGYLDLNPDLAAWRGLLGLKFSQKLPIS